MSCFTKVKLEKSGGTAVIRLNSPNTMNALDGALFAELRAVTNEVSEDDSIGSVVLTGSGRAFCAGGDIRRFEEGFSPGEGYRYMKAFGPWVKAFANMDKPTIAAVNGYAVGAGFCIAMHADIIIAAADAKFGMAFANVGLIPDLGGLYVLPRLVGLNRAKELVFTGRNITAAEAYDMGIVNRVVEAELLESEALTLAARLADGPRIAQSMAKMLLNSSAGMTLPELLEEESLAQAQCIQTEDHKNAVKAFFRKEKPEFRGC